MSASQLVAKANVAFGPERDEPVPCCRRPTCPKPAVRSHGVDQARSRRELTFVTVETVGLVRLLANFPSDDKWPVLRKLTADPSPLVRASAAEALGERPDQANTAAAYAIR